MSGPVPKRSDQRRRRNTSDGPALMKAEAGKDPVIPRASGDWHPIAKRWFQSLKDSGQAQFYEQSDWLTAVYVAEAMSRNLASTKFSAQLFQSVMSAMTDLLTTEGARRRARVELERLEDTEDPAEAARVTLMESYRKAAGGG
ncbi:phage terminase small subunit [Streptomyces sp. NPDC054864]